MTAQWKKGTVLYLIFSFLVICCGCMQPQQQEPAVTKPTPPPPVKPSVQYVPAETHPLEAAYKEQPDAYVHFSQDHQQPYEVYVPVEEVMAYTTQYPDCTGTWYRDQLQGEDLLIYNCYLYALEHCYHWFSLYVEDNDRDIAFLREAVSFDSPLIEQNMTHYERTDSWATNYWGEQVSVHMNQFVLERWEMRMEALEKCRQIVAEIPAEYTQLEKMEYVYRYVCDHVEYVKYETMKDEDFLYDAVIKGQTLCDGYSNMLMLLFRLIGVECCEVAGYDVDPTSEEVYEDAGGHTWVAAKVDGNWYNFDATYEDTKGEDWENDTMYFGFSDLLLDKEFLDCDTIRPKCTDTSRDFPYADHVLQSYSDKSGIKQLVKLAESRLGAENNTVLVAIYEPRTEKKYEKMFDYYGNYASKRHHLENRYAEMGSYTLMWITVIAE
jgi:hypothetical protein